METLKLPFTFNVELIKKELAQFSKEDYYNIYNPSVEADTLWAMHFIEPINGKNGLPEFVPNKALQKCPYLLKILQTFKCKKETFRVHILDANAAIRPHRDIGYRIEDGKVRIHIPVETNSEVQLLVNNTIVKMSEGECWYCNFHIKHQVYNNSNVPRKHLILDCMANEWLENLFTENSKNTSLFKV
ncbi:aspartyl/asparaginyl beta-hydroxylase domain-containing protein [Polaribacter sp.]|uniref:aspartyl/asparaginyl beta-hydroxylase domain-containing protein n=1 Tax=Polaribacter sp. TaxID=1920175 RepID=UPI003EF1ACF6